MSKNDDVLIGAFRDKKAAQYLGIGVSTLWLFTKQGKIKSIKLSEKITVWTKEELDSYITSCLMPHRGLMMKEYIVELNSVDIALLLAYGAKHNSQVEGFEDSVKYSLAVLKDNNFKDEISLHTKIIGVLIVDILQGNPNKSLDALLMRDNPSEADAFYLYLHGKNIQELGGLLDQVIVKYTTKEQFDSSVGRITSMLNDISGRYAQI